jgi:antitoxin component HigA of HigAB toxin-antitoxin module
MLKIVNISKEREYRQALAAIEPFLKKGFAELSTQEDEELARISALIEAYENVHYPPKTEYLK